MSIRLDLIETKRAAIFHLYNFVELLHMKFHVSPFTFDLLINLVLNLGNQFVRVSIDDDCLLLAISVLFQVLHLDFH